MNTMQKELKIRGYSKQTIKAYDFHNKAFLKLLKKSPRQVTHADIKDYITYLIDAKYERSTINLAISALKFYYREILKRRFFIKRMRTQKKLFDVLSINETQRLFLTAKNQKHRLVLQVLYYTGIRLSELINLKTNDIDFERNTIHIHCGKGRKDRFVTMQELLIIEIKKYLKTHNSTYLFSTLTGKYSERSIQKICNNYAKKAKITKHVTPHTLRRTFATHKIEDKTDIFHLQKLMGHSNTNTTVGYISYAIKI